MRMQAGLACVLAILGLMLPAWGLSVEDEVEVGKSIMSDVRPWGLTADSSLEAVGRRLAAAAIRKDLPWRFWVVENLQFCDAFAAPGGLVFITRRYFEKLDDDQTAFVIAHEMAHIDLCHYEGQAKPKSIEELRALVFKVATGREGVLSWSTGGGRPTAAYLKRYGPALEREADRAGYALAEAAGYDAAAAVTALSRVSRQLNRNPWAIDLRSSHPLLSDQPATAGDQQSLGAEPPPPSPNHARRPVGGPTPFDPTIPIAVRLLGPDGELWADRWRQSLTKLLHDSLEPLGLEIAGADRMSKPRLGDPTAAARGVKARYLLLVTAQTMYTTATGPAVLSGTPVDAGVELNSLLIDVRDGARVWEGRATRSERAVDLLPADPAVLYTDTCVGALAYSAAEEVALACAKAVRDR